MAAEMSCLTGVDEDDKDTDPGINALTLLQEPVRMTQESASCTDSFGKPLLKQNSVLHVLSSTDMLSSVGLGNGPSLHQATQAHELNSISTEKEEAKSITPLKTVQEIDTAGIWGFDADSPENSLDHFDNAGDLHWDPHKEFMQFLWDNHGDSPGEEPEEKILPTDSQRRRKRKMDMVVMADPSEDIDPDVSHKLSEDSTDAEVQVDLIPVRKVRKSRKVPKSQSSSTVKVSKYPNGTVKAIKEILYNSPARNSHENNVCHGFPPIKRRLTINSQSQKKPSCYRCSKCKLIFKKEHHLHRHMKSHAEISSKPFVCRKCGQAFERSSSLLEHVSVHQETRERLTEEIKDINDKKREDKNAKLFCPQCPFITNCPNIFVQHAKTHDKEKRKFKCKICSFRTLSEHDLRRHNIMQHTVISGGKQIQHDQSEIFSCNICSYRAFSKTVFRNHLFRRHQQTMEEYTDAQLREMHGQAHKELPTPTCKAPVEDAEFTSKISIKNQISSKEAYIPSDANDISDLFKNSRIKRSPKSHSTESKLDKSINVLLSRQRHGKKTAEQRKESNVCSIPFQETESFKDECPGKLTIDKDLASSPNHLKVPSSADRRDLNSSSVPKDLTAMKKSPSKRKMSIPYRNTSDQDSCFILPKPLPSPKKINLEEEKQMFPFNDMEASLCENGIKNEKPNIIYTYSRRMSMRGALQASKRLFEKIKSEEQEQNDPEIKEENIESEIFPDAFASNQMPLPESFAEDVLELETDHKNCPYCPAVFESGVGLSNHIRGHLHRVGLHYNARHVVSPEQVACQDKRPRFRRKISALRRLKKAIQLESDTETVRNIHSCPLCGDSFDNRTGQSNHIRGHLKKLGKSIATKTKSPLILLRELMRDKKELQRAIQILGKKRNHFQYGASSKLPNVDSFTSSSVGIPKNTSVQSVCTEDRPLVPLFSLARMESEEEQQETKLDVKNCLTGTSALIGILKKRKCQEDAKIKGSSWMSRNVLEVSSNNEHISGPRVASSPPKSISEKGEFNRKVCVHCNATFHSGVSLSNHLRAYAKRKRTALLEGTTFDCKVRRQRSRPGSKKKTLPLPQTPEEMYRLTCRFCDLVFQGPLSVQEDWIKHLQRHIMSTSVPHTGLGMVEVTSLPATLKTDQESSSTATHAAS